MLNFYLLFHLNLMYSSIEEEERKAVIDKCYHPLLNLAQSGIPIGIEAPALTLEFINDLDKSWIEKLKNLIKKGKVEFIGSGYSQIIGPLMPKALNEKNQQLGLEIYKNILGIAPKIALINEMAYSAGIVDIYADSGYKAIIMEWNNPYRFHKEWKKDLKYFPQIAIGVDKKLPIIWANSIAFQKFQRYAHGEIMLKDYVNYLSSQLYTQDRYFPLYANDAEIFNFRPGRYKTEANIEHNEWNRIKKLLCVLKQKKDFDFIKPSDLLKKTQNNELLLQSPEQPIPVKKQEKYNINRWALTGRNDLEVNTKVYKIYDAFLNGNPTEKDLKKLLYFASSDFRTHITKKRWVNFKKELDWYVDKWVNELKSAEMKEKCDFALRQNRYELYIETDKLKVVFNKQKGLIAKEVVFKEKSNKALIGTITHGFYDDISLGADFFSFHSIIEKPAQHKFTNLYKVEPLLDILNNNVIIQDKQESSDISFEKTYSIYKGKLQINIKIELPKRDVAIIRPFNITFLPSAFDKNSLFFATHNGGKLEKFYLKNIAINHSQSLSALISAKYGLGATEGVVIIGDKEKQIHIAHDQTKSALIPSVYYLPMGDTFFLRLQYSAQEIDDTFKENNIKQIMNCSFSIE